LLPTSLVEKAKTTEGLKEISMLGVPDELKSVVKITKAIPVMADNVSGVELHSEADLGAAKLLDITRMFVVNDRLFSVGVMSGGTPPSEMGVFFDSFRIGGPSPFKADPTSPKSDSVPVKGDPGPQPTGAVPAGWVSFKSPDANYSVAMPQQPDMAPLKLPIGDVKLYVAKLPNGTALVTQAHPIPADELAKAGGAEGALNQLMIGLAMSGNKVFGEGELSLGQYKGRECRMTLKGPQGQNIIMFTRAYLVGNYLVLLQGPASGESPAQETAAFFNSLKIGD
jgi:hypothetical protein